MELKTRLTRDIELSIPLVSAAMDTVTEARLAIAMAQEGGIGIVHKNMTAEQQAAQVRLVKKYESGVIKDPITVPPNTTIREVLELTRQHNISGVPVVDGEQLVGIVTNRDTRFETRFNEPVSSIMTGKDKLVGIQSELVGPQEMKKIFPLINTDGVAGGLYHPHDGHVDPASVTQAMAKGARNRGAEIYTHNPVTDISQTPAGEWVVHTRNGDITCEYVVNAAGLWTAAIGAMVGLYLPVIAMEHQHILFEDVPELVESGLQQK